MDRLTEPQNLTDGPLLWMLYMSLNPVLDWIKSSPIAASGRITALFSVADAAVSGTRLCVRCRGRRGTAGADPPEPQKGRPLRRSQKSRRSPHISAATACTGPVVSGRRHAPLPAARGICTQRTVSSYPASSICPVGFEPAEIDLCHTQPRNADQSQRAVQTERLTVIVISVLELTLDGTISNSRVASVPFSGIGQVPRTALFISTGRWRWRRVRGCRCAVQ